MAVDLVIEQALKLSVEERTELAERLLDSLDEAAPAAPVVKQRGPRSSIDTCKRSGKGGWRRSTPQRSWRRPEPQRDDTDKLASQ